MEEESNAKANPIGNNESLMTEDPEQPSGSKEGSQSSGASSSTTEASLNTINVTTQKKRSQFQRIYEKLEDLERQMDQYEQMNELFIHLLATIQAELETI
uniref:HDC19854 n=1 Tax=Drosophila melanogaster TaxID=7227 RepID=Q6II39_DROME|nr:uncharacterized protein Dmel_CG42580 [Drosophila melanogaster]ACZ95344.1 uncharacterized protein Dmel_CG42580 [Drosophila melanogaster]DAA03427.1 TPA_inf: HDC19854 [Drosophila melanogaster]|eukprot:NP_001162811.1 uncharacterized protein Dmel_CG42580 [Drosophila melanogaster]